MTNFDIPITLYYNKENKNYIKKFLKMKFVGIKSNLEEIDIGNIKIDLSKMANEGKCKFISRREIG